MSERQQVLYLWLAESALDTETVAWAFYDGTQGDGPDLPEHIPPYANGLAALQAGWMLIQSPVAMPVVPGQEHEVSHLPYEFVFERRFPG
ncbi:MAG: hypothetical protein AAGA91_07225 [Pseudomonadota bacterium]